MRQENWRAYGGKQQRGLFMAGMQALVAGRLEGLEADLELALALQG